VIQQAAITDNFQVLRPAQAEENHKKKLNVYPSLRSNLPRQSQMYYHRTNQII